MTSKWAGCIRMQKHVLSRGEIIRLKQYIIQKHHPLDAIQQASILSDAVHRIIESRLPSFPDAMKKQVRHALLLKNKANLSILYDDVLEHCMTLDLTDEELISPLTIWVSNQLDTPVQENMIRDILYRWSEADIGDVTFDTLEKEIASEDRHGRMQIATASDASVHDKKNGLYYRGFVLTIVSCISIIMLLLWLTTLSQPTYTTNAQEEMSQINTQSDLDLARRMEPGIPEELTYVSIDSTRLKQYLKERNSKLAEEPYMSAIINASEKYDIHPLLLFAITGQEQGLVPNDHKQVDQIANNPFNVYGSWERYNTTIESSAAIAAKTVRNISSRRPSAKHPIQWLNTTYAEDPNWWKGVTWFFVEMKQEIEQEAFEWPE